MSKLQVLYIQKQMADYMQTVHHDDRESGIVGRMWDHPSPEHDCAILVLPSHTKDISVDLVLEHVHQMGDVDTLPIYVEFDPAFAETNAMWIKQDEDAVVVRSAAHAVDIAMRLLLWAQLEQTKEQDQ